MTPVSLSPHLRFTQSQQPLAGWQFGFIGSVEADSSLRTKWPIKLGIGFASEYLLMNAHTVEPLPFLNWVSQLCDQVLDATQSSLNQRSDGGQTDMKLPPGPAHREERPNFSAAN